MARHTSNQGYNKLSRILLAYCGGLAVLALLFVIFVECWAASQKADPEPAAASNSAAPESGGSQQPEPAGVSPGSCRVYWVIFAAT